MNTMSIIACCIPGIAFPKTLPATWIWPCIRATSTSLPLVFERLRKKDYVCFQCLDHSINGHFFVFCWDRSIRSENRGRRPRLRSSPQRIDSGHRRGNGRRAQAAREFWIPSEKIEFGYLLAKKSWKGKTPERQSIAPETIGGNRWAKPEAERVAGTVFSGKWRSKPCALV